MEAMTLTSELKRKLYDEYLSIYDGDKEKALQDLGAFYLGWLAIAPHLAQPAQAVDVGLIAECSEALRRPASVRPDLDTIADKLTRALSGEKAGPVGDGFDGERYTDMVDAYDEALRVGWNREQAMGCAIRAYYAAAPSQRAEVK